MSKQFRVTIDGGDPSIIDIKDNEAIDIHVESSASKFFEAAESTLRVRITGMRWADDDYFTFEWNRSELGLNSDVRIQIVEGNAEATPVLAEEKYVEPEKACSFCERPASQVQHLIDGGLFAKICDACVAECQRLIDEKRAI
jgi:hypothetical protein